jgi:O-antigen/teichoic acid export membrane protein
MRRFGAYGLYMGSEGVIRLLACGVLAAVGVESVGAYGIVAGFPPMVAIALAVRGQKDLVVDGPEAPWSELTSNLAYLLAGSVLSAALINAGPIAVKLLSTKADETLTGSFLNAVVITRVPLFLFQAVQASLLPKLAGYAGAGQWDEFRVRFRRLMLFVAAIGATAIAGSFVLGPLAMRILFGSEYELGRRTMTMLATAAAGYMVAIGMAQALIALHGHARAALGWAIAMVVLVTTIALGDDLLLRVEVGLVAASIAAAISFGLLLRPLLGRPLTIAEEDLMEAIVDLPLEG